MLTMNPSTHEETFLPFYYTYSCVFSNLCKNSSVVQICPTGAYGSWTPSGKVKIEIVMWSIMYQIFPAFHTTPNDLYGKPASWSIFQKDRHIMVPCHLIKFCLRFRYGSVGVGD